MISEMSPMASVGLLTALVAAGSAGGIYLANAASRRPVASPPPSIKGAAVNKLKAFACLLYVLSPVDLIPEAVLGPFGVADDVVAAVVGLRAWFRKGGN